MCVCHMFNKVLTYLNTACKAAKIGKAAGSDGVSMEAFVHRGLRLGVHLTLLFSCSCILAIFLGHL